MARTHRQQIIEQVAGIYREWDWQYHDEADFAAANEEGFPIDLRFDDGEYVNDTDWTRVEGVTLTAAELAEARRIGGENLGPRGS